MPRLTQSPLPAVARVLAQVGENLRLARFRRHFSVTLVAERAGMSRATLRAVERGDPGVSLGALANVLHCLGLEKDLASLASDGGWALAPAYDLNPVASGDGLTLNISETDNTQDLSLVLEVAEHFRVKGGRAASIVSEVRKAVRGWPKAARALSLSRGEQERMAPAFRRAAD
jgi:transcriptional regulator with XRE-family HTH domain